MGGRWIGRGRRVAESDAWFAGALDAYGRLAATMADVDRRLSATGPAARGFREAFRELEALRLALSAALEALTDGSASDAWGVDGGLEGRVSAGLMWARDGAIELRRSMAGLAASARPGAPQSGVRPVAIPIASDSIDRDVREVEGDRARVPLDRAIAAVRRRLVRRTG